MRICLPLALLASTTLAAQAAPVGLSELAKIARARAAAQRPAQIAAIQPYLEDLGYKYKGDNVSYLEAKFDEIAKLGDTIVPLLLEYLTPADSRPESANRADNVARVLQRLDPADYCDTLIDLLRGESKVARANAIRLLGWTGERRAEAALIERLDHLDDVSRADAVDSLTRLESKSAVPAITKLLASENQKLRFRALLYLTPHDDASGAVAKVLGAFQREKSDQLLGYYIDYFRAHVRDDATLAANLLPYLQGSRLGFDDREALIRTLGAIAPRRDRTTLDALTEIIEKGHVGRLEMAAALALRELEEKSGVKKIGSRLDQQVRKRRSDADVYSQRGDWHRELGDWRDAIRDYESAIKYSRSRSGKAVLFMLVARCEAQRGRIPKVRAALKASGWSRRMIEREAVGDAVFAATLKHDKLQSFLRDLK